MSIAKFSDFPFYMLNDYFTKLKAFYENIDHSVEDKIENLYNDIIFQEPWLDYHSGEGFLSFSAEYNDTESKTVNIRLKGPKVNIVANGSEYTTFYAKIENYGYKAVKLKPILDDDFINTNWFNFDRYSKKEYTFGIWDYEEIEQYLNKLKIEYSNVTPTIRPIGLSSDKVIEKTLREKYLVVERITSNDNELIENFNNFTGSIIDPIDITKSKEDKSFAFKIWMKKELSEDISLEPENELYLRIDSLFYDWYRKNLKNYGNELTNNGIKVLTEKEIEDAEFSPWNHENFINENILFAFVGCCWPMWNRRNSWKIFHKSMKDFMINSIPDNDISPAFRVFTWELFDRVYQEVYNQQKNIYTLLDPEEINEKFLGYLALFYNFDLDVFNDVSLTNRRYFIRNLPYLLKKKGSWTSLKMIWENLLRQTNRLTFYERWHTKYKKKSISNFMFNDIEETNENI